jgi:hypothetical protein
MFTAMELFAGGHATTHKPDDPIEHWSRLVDNSKAGRVPRMASYLQGGSSTILVFLLPHVMAMFTAMDLSVGLPKQQPTTK